MYPIAAGVILTRLCNLHCKYCAIPERKATELPVEDWLAAIDIIADLNIKKINFIGGEATLYKGVEEVVSYAMQKIEDCSLITNGIKGYAVVKHLLSSGMKNISFSLDTLDIDKSISPIKARAGIEFIKALESDNLLQNNNFTAYCVINKTNLKTIPAMVEYLSEKHISTYFLPFHWNKNNEHEHRKDDYGLALQSNDELNNLLQKLSDMKKSGYLIKNSAAFFDAIKKYVDHLNWKCSYLSELRVDSDGKMMCCCDKQGDVHNKYTIFDLRDKKIFQQFLADRQKDAYACCGCLWPSSYEAEKLNKEREHVF